MKMKYCFPVFNSYRLTNILYNSIQKIVNKTYLLTSVFHIAPLIPGSSFVRRIILLVKIVLPLKDQKGIPVSVAFQ